MDIPVSGIDWHKFSYDRAEVLPRVINEVASSERWHPGSLEHPVELWEELGRATYNGGEIPDVAYAVLPCLITVARQQNRSAPELCLVLGYLLDTTLGGICGRDDIPAELVEQFVSCIALAKQMADECDVSALPPGEKLRISAARLLAPKALASAYLVYSLLIEDLVLVCPHCSNSLAIPFDGDTKVAVDGRGRRAHIIDCVDEHWASTVLARVRDHEAMSGELHRIRHLVGEVQCQECQRNVTFAAGVMAAMATQCPISRVHGWELW